MPAQRQRQVVGPCTEQCAHTHTHTSAPGRAPRLKSQRGRNARLPLQLAGLRPASQPLAAPAAGDGHRRALACPSSRLWLPTSSDTRPSLAGARRSPSPPPRIGARQPGGGSGLCGSSSPAADRQADKTGPAWPDLNLRSTPYPPPPACYWPLAGGPPTPDKLRPPPASHSLHAD